MSVVNNYFHMKERKKEDRHIEIVILISISPYKNNNLLLIATNINLNTCTSF